MSRLHEVTVLGSGVLGGQIAWHSAFKGKTVSVYDIAEEALDSCRAMHERYAEIYRSTLGATEAEIAATKQRLTFTSGLAEAVAQADLVIEAVPEVPDVKTAVYEQMAGLLPTDALVATNSSTFLPSDFAEATGRPERFCALHFANLIWAINFAEVMGHAGTTRETLTQVTEFAIEIGMVPIPVLKEHNGYVVNTWFVALLNSAQTLVTNGIASAEDVDRTYQKQGAPVGPFGMMDQVGMATTYNILSYWGARNDDPQMRDNAEYVKARFLDEGLLGVASGKGYYEYPDPAYGRGDFLDVPDISSADDIVGRMFATELTVSQEGR